jgi:hypothetical protein
MTHPHTTGGGDSLHIWKAAANKQDKQTYTTSPPNFGFEQETITHHKERGGHVMK